MESKSILDYFFFGACVRYLQDAIVGHELSMIIQNIDNCLDWLNSLGLYVTQNASRDFVSFRDELHKITKKDTQLSPKQSQDLTRICSQLRITLEAELVSHEAFIVTPKRFDTNKLLYDIGSLMTPNVFSALPEITQYDLMEAGKCIAFELPTAAAFHLLRGTEAELRFFYYTLILRKRVDPLMWGDMVKDLRTRSRTRRHATLYNNLDNIRHSYRNPTQHPEAIYNIHDVQDLCPLCFEAISRMAKILQSI